MVLRHNLAGLIGITLFVVAVGKDDMFDKATIVAKTLLPGFPAESLGLWPEDGLELWTGQLGWHSGYTLKALSNFGKCARAQARANTSSVDPLLIEGVEAVIARAFANVSVGGGPIDTFGDKYE